MNLIVCDQDCHHQQEGYCTLNQVTSLTGSTQSTCGYYRKKGALPGTAPNFSGHEQKGPQL